MPSIEYVYGATPPVTLDIDIEPSDPPLQVGFVPVEVKLIIVGCVTVALVDPTSPKESFAYMV